MVDATLMTPVGTVRHRPSGKDDGLTLCGLEGATEAPYPEATLRVFRVCFWCERKASA